VGALLGTLVLNANVRAQSFGGWLPFRDDKKESVVRPPTSLGASSAGKTADDVRSGGAQSTTTPPKSDVPPSQVASGGTPPATNRILPEKEPSFFPGFAWPEFQMPYFPKPRMPSLPGKQELDQARNTWVEPSPEPAKPSPWQAVNMGATRVKESSANAWHKTVDLLTPGSDDTPPARTRVAQREPSLWNRWFSSGETEREGPQTVPEWMAQERIKP
jgi:hypothetical protein